MQPDATTRCTKIKKDGTRCKKPPITGGTVCATAGHGGTLPVVKQAAAFRIARDKAQQAALTRLRDDKAGRVETITEMDRIAAEAIAFKDAARDLLDDVINGGIRYEGRTGEQLRAEVALYERALDRCNTILATNLKLGIAEKRQELDRNQALIVAEVIRKILERAGLSPDQKKIIPGIIIEEMHAISAQVS